MLSKQLFTEHIVSLNELFPNFTQQFLEPFKNLKNPELSHEMLLDFEIIERGNRHKISPILRVAKPEDAKEITEIYKELYDGTYPYKEMEDVEEVRRLIQNPNIQWIIYQDPNYNIAGCITFVLDFGNKRGYIRGFMLKKKYQGYIDITKAMIGSMLGMIHKYKHKIYVWYVENRTAHSKSQYSMWVCGIAPIGFYPNKDIFLGKVESDLMQILYDERALIQYRSKKIPELIPEVENCYLYANKRYNLGDFQIKEPKISLNQKKIHQLKKRFKIDTRNCKFGYKMIRFSFSNTESYFEFLYTPQVKNFEKTAYHVNNLEELYVFLKEFIKYGKDLGIRYCEAFISAYNIEHQKLFSNVGLSPRGYVPSWSFNSKKGVFEDHILFNWFEGKISETIQLINEGKQLLEILELNESEDATYLNEERTILEKIPRFYSFKEKLSNVWNYPKMIKMSLITGL
ncbi:MAG: GNAT family N-acetyltransferase, partial [Candidatus Hermodarchaeota archaeon]